MRLTSSFLALPLMTLVIACGQKSSLNLRHLPAASSSAPAPTHAFPTVVSLNGCTGIFVSPRIVLTASHCLKRGGLAKLQTPWGNHAPVETQSLGPGIEGDLHDLGVILFAHDIAPQNEIHPIGANPKIGEPVTLVGYGCGGFSQRHGDRAKRSGTNVLYRVGDYLELYTPLASAKAVSIIGPANLAGSCFGDSGGPLFRGTPGKYELIGIDHAAVFETQSQISEYIDLNESKNRAFLVRLGIVK